MQNDTPILAPVHLLSLGRGDLGRDGAGVSMWAECAMIRGKQVSGEATAFRLWQAASQMDWNCTIKEAADAAGIPYGTAFSAVRRKGWGNRFYFKGTKAKIVQHERGEVPDVLEQMGL